MFSINTYGPFKLQTSRHRFAPESFWVALQSEKADLGSMFGIYIFARELPDGSLQPIYVGKTVRSYLARLKSHFKSSTVLSNINDLSEGDTLSVFLIAVRSPKKGAAAKVTTSRSRWVDFLETALIAACKSLNKELQNDKKTLLNEKVCVPGFLGDDPATRDGSARGISTHASSSDTRK